MSFNNKFLSAGGGSDQSLTDGTADIFVNTARVDNLLSNFLVSSSATGELITNSSGNVSVGYNINGTEILTATSLDIGTLKANSIGLSLGTGVMPTTKSLEIVNLGDVSIAAPDSISLTGGTGIVQINNSGVGIGGAPDADYACSVNGVDGFSLKANSLDINSGSLKNLLTLGINNNSPSYTLDVNGTARITGDLTVGGTIGTKPPYIQLKQTTGLFVFTNTDTYLSWPTTQTNYGGIFTLTNSNTRVQISQGGLYRVCYKIFVENSFISTMGQYGMYNWIRLTDSSDAAYTTNYFAATSGVGGYATTDGSNWYYFSGSADINVVVNDKIGLNVLHTRPASNILYGDSVNNKANNFTITRIGDNYGNIN